MTDKQIIIDGVDVADCEHINACDKKMKCVILQDDVCETNPYCEGFNCYYKQLKGKEQRIVKLNKTIEAKEQECEELKKQWEFSVTHKMILEKDYIAELDQLKVENDELKKIIKRLDVPKHEVIDMDIALENEKLRTENEELKEQLELNTANAVVIDMAQRLYKLKQTLTEIKEIAETCSFTDNIQLLLNRFDQILQKISECEVEQ